MLNSVVAKSQISGAADTFSAEAKKVEKKPLIEFLRHIEVYYGYDFNQPPNNTRPPFVYSHNRHNEVNINLAYIKGSYSAERVRATLAIAAGTYVNANYAAEPGVLKSLNEANVGVKLSGKKGLWLDAGIMVSHIGFESAYSPACWTLTRSIMADNSPYYETGAKLGYTSDNGQWYMAALVLNGWQRIQRVPTSSWPSGGTQLTYTPSDRVTLNYSTYIGDDKPDSLSALRIFHDLYGTFNLTDKFGLTSGIDFGMQERLKQNGWSNWLGAAIIARYKFSKKTALAARGEYYLDRDGVIIPTTTSDGFNTMGASINFDYYIMKVVLWRVEIKMYDSEDAVFSKEGKELIHTNAAATTSLSISF
ncbi:porin [Polluticoccus soli]|uniref:porin n=1 Tax=Polluticoccus soli TaxID=3034150 RepID=UPI0023E1927D|nr:porin [Flavipsychrobacter sp. JY13-12]